MDRIYTGDRFIIKYEKFCHSYSLRATEKI